MVVDKILEYLRDGHQRSCPPALMDTATRLIREAMERHLTTDTEEEERRHVSASSPWYCSRKMMYGVLGQKRGEGNPRRRLTFTIGSTVEQFVVLLTKLAGVDVITPGDDGVQEGGAILCGGREIPWHMDMTIRGPSGEVVPVDVKSLAKIGFEQFEAAILDPSHKWWTENRWSILTQLRLYMKAKNAQYGLFVGISKETGIPAEMTVPQDPAWWEEMERRSAYVKQHEDAKTIPPRPSWAEPVTKTGANTRPDGTKGPVQEVLNFPCGYCDWVETCFPGFARVPLDRPVWRKAVSA